MATHSSVLAWRIPRTGEPGGCRLWGGTESDQSHGGRSCDLNPLLLGPTTQAFPTTPPGVRSASSHVPPVLGPAMSSAQGGRYYCKAENGVGVPAIKSIRVDVQCESGPLSLPKARGLLLGAQAGKKEWGGGWRRGTSMENNGRDSLFQVREGHLWCSFDLHYPDPFPEKAVAPHSSTLAWKIPWMEEPGAAC